MMNITEIDNEILLESGTILRIYGVNRMDVMKLAEYRDDPRKKAKDYYDLLLFDSSNIKENTFAIVNVTLGSSNRGYVYAVFNTESRYAIKAEVIKEYFKGNNEVFILKGTAAK